MTACPYCRAAVGELCFDWYPVKSLKLKLVQKGSVHPSRKQAVVDQIVKRMKLPDPDGEPVFQFGFTGWKEMHMGIGANFVVNSPRLNFVLSNIKAI